VERITSGVNVRDTGEGGGGLAHNLHYHVLLKRCTPLLPPERPAAPA